MTFVQLYVCLLTNVQLTCCYQSFPDSVLFIFVFSQPVIVLVEQSCIAVEQYIVLLRHYHQSHCCFLLSVQFCSSGYVSRNESTCLVSQQTFLMIFCRRICSCTALLDLLNY